MNTYIRLKSIPKINDIRIDLFEFFKSLFLKS